MWLERPPDADGYQPATPDAVETARPVLVVDDERDVRSLFGRWLSTAGYAVETAGSAQEALACQQARPAAVVVCDIRMPDRDGLWLAEQLRDQYPETAVIMVTGAPDLGSAVTSLRQGVADYLSKPFSVKRLRESVKRGYEWHQAVVDLRSGAHGAAAGADHAGGRPDAISVESAAALDGLLSMVLVRDSSAYEHAYRVSALSADLGRALEVGEPALSTIERAALLHDIGKTALPEAVLYKRGSLTAEELGLVRQHPQIAYELLRGLWPYLAGTADIVRATQERFDGLGFPNGLKGHAIPLGARVIAVADVYDTMTHPRVFRQARSSRDTLREIVAASGAQFDPRIVDVFQQSLAPTLH